MKEIESLEAYHGRKLSEQAAADYESVLVNYSNLAQAVEEWKFRHSPMDKFPAISDLTGLAFEIKCREWQKNKEKEPEIKDLVRNAKTDHARIAVAQIVALCEGKIDKMRFLEWMNGMERDFPDWGWRVQALNLKQWYGDQKERFDRSLHARRDMMTKAPFPRNLFYPWE